MCHPHLRRLGQAPLRLRDGPDLPAQAHLAEKHGVRRERAIVHARRERSRNREVTSRLLQPNAAHDVEKHIELSERKPGALVEHGEQQREPPTVEAGRDPLRRSEPRLRGQRLDLDQHRPCPFHECRHRAPRRDVLAIAEE